MDTTAIFTTILSLVLIFLFAIQKFSHQIQLVAGERLKFILNKWTDTPLKGILSGAFVTSIIQSSTAASVILVSLVNAELIPSFNAISVVIGANIGSTVTAQLIALNMTFIAPIVVIIGFIIAHTHSRFRRYGKSIFYFGVMFLTLFLIRTLVEPLKDSLEVVAFLHSLSNPYAAILVGAIITIILQSSSVLTGLVLILASQGLVDLPAAIGFMLGAAIGSPITAVIASTSASIEAKKVAMANVLFNLIGAAIFIPIIWPLITLLKFTSDAPAQQIVNAHFIFNIGGAVIAFIFFKQFEKLVRKTTVALYKK